MTDMLLQNHATLLITVSVASVSLFFALLTALVEPFGHID